MLNIAILKVNLIHISVSYDLIKHREHKEKDVILTKTSQ